VKNEIVIKSSADTTQIAFLEDQRLVEFVEEQNELSFSIGNIYLAKVKRVVPGLNAAFVNIGHDRDGFLHYQDLGSQFLTIKRFLQKTFVNNSPPDKFKKNKDLSKNGSIEDVVKIGDFLMVQIVKEPISTKGPRLTSEISIAGRNMILIPFSNEIFLSQKITNKEERLRLQKLMKSIKPDGFGVILRTLSEGTSAATIDQELKDLIEKWKQVTFSINRTNVPKLLINEIDRTRAYLRDILNPSFDNIYVNNENTFQEIKEYLTIIGPKKKLY